MNRAEILRLLKEHEAEIKKFGVRGIGLFGSFSRDEGTEDSDVNIVVEFETGKATFKNFGGLSEYLENLLGREVDILTPAGIESIRIEEVKQSIMRDIP